MREIASTQSSRRTSTIGEDLKISGNVTCHGEIQLDGYVLGDVRGESVILGEGSQLEGGVIAEDVVVHGRLIGSVRALRVTLRSNAHVEGDIFHQSLAVERGAYFQGKSRRSDDPIAERKRFPITGDTKERHIQRSDGSTRRLGSSLSGVKSA